MGRHNADAIEQLLDIVEGLGGSIVFQPVRNSLFVYTQRDGKAWELEHQRSLATFARIEAAKRQRSSSGKSMVEPAAFPQLSVRSATALRRRLDSLHDGSRRRAVPLR